MPIKSYRPYTPSRRHMTSADYSDLTVSRPEKSLVRALKRKGGRNNTGMIMVRHQGGGGVLQLGAAQRDPEAGGVEDGHEAPHPAHDHLLRHDEGVQRQQEDLVQEAGQGRDGHRAHGVEVAVDGVRPAVNHGLGLHQRRGDDE